MMIVSEAGIDDQQVNHLRVHNAKIGDLGGAPK